jgi:hypothetical protein
MGVSITRVGAKFLDQTGQHLERRAGLGHILAHQEHGRVAAHFFGNGLVHGLGQGNLAHVFSPQAAKTCMSTSDASG